MKAIFSTSVLLLVMLMGSLIAQEDSLNDRLYYIEGNSLMALQLSTGEATSVITRLPRLLDRALSPTNDFMVYRAEPEMFAEEIAAECPCGGELPSDLVLIDLATGETTLIAGQPEDSTLSTGITRSAPVWSPDGTMLAWAEGLEISTLVIYNRLTGETIRGTDEIPAQTLASSTAKLTSWTHSGIIVHTVDFGATLSENIVGYRIYASDVTLLSEITPQFDDPSINLVARYGNSEVLAIKSAEQNWVFLDIMSGDPIDIETGRFATYAIAAPENSLRWLTPTVTSGQPPSVSFEIRDANNNALGDVYTGSAQLAPFGDAIVLQENNQLTIWRSPEDTTTIDLSTGFVVFDTVPVQIEILETGTPLITTFACEDSLLDIRLLMEITGYVLGNTPNNVREEPNTSAAIAGQVAAGDWFDIVNGPSCSDGIAWWQISTPDVTGWMAEGVDGEYFIQPGCPEGGCTRG